MEQLNERIWKIWDKHSALTDGLNRAPLIYPEMNRAGFLCVGMNPSFSEGESKLNTSSKLFNDITRNKFYSIETAKQFGESWNFEELDQQAYSFNNHPYHKLYKKIIDLILEPLCVDFQHVDLFPIRETSQKLILSLLQKEKTNKKNYPNLNELGKDLLNVFIEMLNFISPDYLMINNAEVSHILLSHFGVHREKGLDQERGCYYFDISGKQVPVFCSGMLSGQRALDVYSRERLFWHIKSFIKANKKCS